MVYIDHKKMADERKKEFDKLMARRDKVYNLAEKHKDVLRKRGLELSVIPTGSAGIEHGFRGNKSVDSCSFDNEKLGTCCSPITYSSSEGFPRALYRCKKCKIIYDLPLNEKDRKRYEKGMSEMVFG